MGIYFKLGQIHMKYCIWPGTCHCEIYCQARSTSMLIIPYSVFARSI